MIYPVEMHET